MKFAPEEIRNAVLETLSGNIIGGPKPCSNLNDLKNNVDNILKSRLNEDTRRSGVSVREYVYDDDDAQEIIDCFYDFFRQGIVSPGVGKQENFPYFHVTRFGKKALQDGENYFFYDLASYEQRLRQEIPGLEDDCLFYLKEAMQAFRTGCYLSSNVMIGVAAEHTFLKVLSTLNSSSAWESVFSKARNKSNLADKVSEFQKSLVSGVPSLPKRFRENIETQFRFNMHCIRTYRNQAGHPHAFKPDRDNAYMNMHMFVRYGQWMYELNDWFENNPSDQEE